MEAPGEEIMKALRIIDNALNTIFNKLKGWFVCSWKGHDYTEPYCFRCWLYCPEMWEK